MGVRITDDLPARSGKEQMQGVRRGEHLPAQSGEEPVQGVRRGEHLPARSEKEHMQGVQRGQHLPAQSDKEQVQDVHSRQGRVHAAGSGGALRHTHTSFCPCQCVFPTLELSDISIDTQMTLARMALSKIWTISPICVGTRSFQYSSHTRGGRLDGRLDASPAAPCLILRLD